MTGDIAVLRLCRCCGRWRSIAAFKPLGMVCQDCLQNDRPTGRIAHSRGIAITPKGRAQLAEWHAEEAPAVA